MTMHRVQAGVLDSFGWTVANSTEGRFSVELPCRFNDFTLVKGAADKLFVVGCKRADGGKFSTTRSMYRDGARAAQQYFDRTAKDGMWPGSKVVAGKYDGAPMADSTIVEDDSCGWGRLIRAGNDNVVLIAEGKGAACPNVESLVPRFFASLKAKRAKS